jgi:mono/diheme cytochrome c family protein
VRPEDRSLPPLLGDPEDPEVLQIHRSILDGEPVEPVEGRERAPWWVWAISVVAIFAMGIYLGRYGGSFDTNPHELYQRSAPATAEAAATEMVPGDVIFTGVCMPCHQAGGVGLEGRYPPLAGSEWLGKDASIPARILLNGLRGPIVARGKLVDGEMPPLRDQLSDAEIAAVLTYVRSSFGNKEGPVAASLVTKLRAETAGQGPGTAESLR